MILVARAVLSAYARAAQHTRATATPHMGNVRSTARAMSNPSTAPIARLPDQIDVAASSTTAAMQLISVSDIFLHCTRM